MARKRQRIPLRDRDPIYVRTVETIGEGRRDWAALWRSPVARGKDTDFDRACGHRGRQWWAQILQGWRRFPVERLSHYLGALRISPAAFFGRAYPRSPGDLAAQALREIASKARRCDLRLLAAAELEPAREIEIGRLLDEADSLREAAPRTALALARKALSEPMPPTAIAARGGMVVGACLRAVAERPRAAAAYSTALALTEELGLPSLYAELMIRASSLLRDDGALAAARQAAVAAVDSAAALGDHERIGAGLSQMGRALAFEGQHSVAAALYGAAAAAWPAWGPPLRQSRAVSLFRSGHKTEALQLSREILASTRNEIEQGYAYWMIAEVELTEPGEDGFETAQKAWQLLSATAEPADRALLLLLLAQACVKRGVVEEAARHLSMASRELLELADSDKVAAAVLREIDAKRAGLRGMTVATIQRIAATWSQHVNPGG